MSLPDRALCNIFAQLRLLTQPARTNGEIEAVAHAVYCTPGSSPLIARFIGGRRC